MKIFFVATPRGNQKNILAIYNQIEKLGHTHTSDFAHDMDLNTFYKADQKMWKKRYIKRQKELSSSDSCIFEISYPSFGVGQLVQEAIRKEKPVILLYYKGDPPHFFTGTAEVEKRVQLLEYDSVSLKDVLEYSLAIANELLTTRFTMLLPANIIKYLDGVKSKSGLSRSEYIRKLLINDMKK